MRDSAILRILDANANRAREALRVLEDVARFGRDDPAASRELKTLRHDLAAALATLPMQAALACRDTAADVGTTIKTNAELSRDSLADVAAAAAKRLTEALRSLEECAKTLSPPAAATLEKLRYRAYIIEQRLLLDTPFSSPAELAARFEKVRLYLLITEALCHPDAGGWEQTLHAILSGVPDATVIAVQLREKNLPDADLLPRAERFTAICHEHGALAIINDRPDIAILAHADGAHLGQNDLPLAAARRLVGSRMILGISTENLSQAQTAQQNACNAGPTYIALGPMFPTRTKEKPRLAGPRFAAEAHAAISLPLVPIGGITPENIAELTAAGIVRAAVCAAIISHESPLTQARILLQKLPP